MCHNVAASTQSPPARQQLLHLVLGKTVIDQEQRALIALGTEHSPGGLHHSLPTGVQIGVVLAGTQQCGHGLLYLFIDRIQLRQPQGRNKGADQARAG